MSLNRRDFLRALAATGVVVMTPPGRVMSTAHGALDSFSRRSASLQVQSFRGSRPGEERVVEGITLCWCPPGRFMMGSAPDEIGHRPDEARVAVSLTRGFWTAKTEVTQADWRRVVGDFPEQQPSARFGRGDRFPLYWVNFHEAEAFCSRLTERARRSRALPGQWAFRLLTEAQWEYACRAGTRTATAFGDVLRRDQANFAGQSPETDRRARPRGSARPVGSYPANAWGIHDMHGNLWEWCRDWYHSRLPGGVDPDLYGLPGEQNRDGTRSRIRRGGAWIEDGWACRSACRLRYEPHRRSDHIGFRVALVEMELATAV